MPKVYPSEKQKHEHDRLGNAAYVFGASQYARPKVFGMHEPAQEPAHMVFVPGSSGYSQASAVISMRTGQILDEYSDAFASSLAQEMSMMAQLYRRYESFQCYIVDTSPKVWWEFLGHEATIPSAVEPVDEFIHGAEYQVSLPPIKNTVFECEAEFAYIREGQQSLALSPDEWYLLREDSE